MTGPQYFWIRKIEPVLRMAITCVSDISNSLDVVAHSFNPRMLRQED